MQVIGIEAFTYYQDKKDALRDLTDSQLQLLLKQSPRCSIRLMFEFSTAQIKDALGNLGIDAKENLEGLGDKRKKSTLIKLAVYGLSTLSKDISQAINQLSYSLGIQDNSYLEDDEKKQLENLRHADQEATAPATVSEEKITQTIKEVDGAIETVRQTAKKVTKAQQKLEKQALLNSLPSEVRWESDFLGAVHIGNQAREFWVTDPYTNPVVNLVASNSTVILSSWDSTKENPFIRAALRAFHTLMDERAGKNSIEDRLLTLSMQLTGSKKRANWYAQSHEALVLNDGIRMEPKKRTEVYKDWKLMFDLVPFDISLLSEGSAYKNAQKLAKTYPNCFEYVEGFILIDHKLVHHAWVRDMLDAKAIEVTFSDTDVQYFGVPFELDWVEKVIASRLKDDTVSDRNLLSIIEGNFLDDFKLLKSGSPQPVAV